MDTICANCGRENTLEAHNGMIRCRSCNKHWDPHKGVKSLPDPPPAPPEPKRSCLVCGGDGKQEQRYVHCCNTCGGTGKVADPEHVLLLKRTKFLADMVEAATQHLAALVTRVEALELRHIELQVHLIETNNRVMCLMEKLSRRGTVSG